MTWKFWEGPCSHLLSSLIQCLNSHLGSHTLRIWGYLPLKYTQMPINRWLDKQNVVYLCCGILFSQRKEWSTDTFYDMDERWKETWISQWKRSRIIMILFLRDIQEREIHRDRYWVGSLGLEEGRMRSIGYFWGWWKVLGLIVVMVTWYCECCTELYTLKLQLWISCVFYHIHTHTSDQKLYS